MKRASWKAWLAWAAVCICWGTTGPGIRVAVRSIPPFLQGGTRFVLAGSVLVAVLLLTGRRLPRDRATWRDVIVAGALLATANGLFATGFLTVTGAVGTLIVTTVAIWIVVFDALRPGGRWPGWLAAVGLVVGLAGVAVLVPWERSLQWGHALAYGSLLAAALVWSFSAVFQRHRELSKRVDPLMNAALQLLIAGVFMIGIGAAIGELPRWNPTREGWMALAYLMVFGSLVGYVSFIYMLEKMPANVVGLYTYLNPLVAATVDMTILREPPGTRFWAAAALVLVSVYLVRRGTLPGTGSHPPSPQNR